LTNDTISRERLEAPPGAVYTQTILEPGYRFMLEHYFHPLVETNKAWVVMLIETGIVDAAAGGRLLDAIAGLEQEGPTALGAFNPRYEYFYSHMERYLIERVGEDVDVRVVGRRNHHGVAEAALEEVAMALERLGDVL